MKTEFKMTTKRVAIIGAGTSGLAAIKCCLDEGLIPVCFERTSEIGGLWRFTPDSTDGQGCVMRSTVINTSKEMMCYSDFPIPAEFSIYMHNSQILKYFRMYADHFNLVKHVHFQTEILSIKRASNFFETGKWIVTSKNASPASETTSETFDAVMVCTGHHASSNVPDFPGISSFKGRVLHSHEYKDFRGFEDKRVVIVGIGNSGGDMAVELSRVSSQVYLSTRHGTWILNRVSDNGMPGDMLFNVRMKQLMFRKLPTSIMRYISEATLNKRVDHEAYSLKPKFSIQNQHPMVNDDLPNRIISGSVKIKSNIKNFTETGVDFDDGTTEENIDTVVLATGYVFGFPFLDKSVIDVRENKMELYKYMFSPNLQKPTLCVVGCIQPIGAIMPISELQCRLFARVIKGTVILPSKEEMWEDIRLKQTVMASRYVKSSRHTIQVDYIAFMDELAELNGCRPDLGKMLLTDPRLAIACFTGPCTPYQYRLSGSHVWKGARDAILSAWDRTLYPLKTRPIQKSQTENATYILRLSAFVIFIAMAWYFFCSAS